MSHKGKRWWITLFFLFSPRSTIKLQNYRLIREILKNSYSRISLDKKENTDISNTKFKETVKAKEIYECK